MAKKLKSIHIDLENNIFELNGERMRCVSELELCMTRRKSLPTMWSLRITKDEIYTGYTGQGLNIDLPKKKFRYCIQNFFKSIFSSVFHKDDSFIG